MDFRALCLNKQKNGIFIMHIQKKEKIHVLHKKNTDNITQKTNILSTAFCLGKRIIHDNILLTLQKSGI